MDVTFPVWIATFLVAALGLLFAFSNGFRDSSTIVATVVSSRSLSPGLAFLLCSLAQFLGALLFGSAVAATIGKGIFGPVLHESQRNILITLTSALLAALIWGVISWWRAWPTSNNQALFAGFVGANCASWGWGSFDKAVIFRVLLVLILSPSLGFLVSTFITRLARFFGEWMTPKITPLFRTLHVAACLLLSFGHGSNDGQVVMGILILALGWNHVFSGVTIIPPVIRMAVALALGAGVLLGGKRILRRLGMSFYRIRPAQGFSADVASAGTIMACTLFGFPASTTQVITGSIVGAGAARSLRAVRWHVAKEIGLSWLITIPLVAVLSAVICFLVRFGLGVP